MYICYNISYVLLSKLIYCQTHGSELSMGKRDSIEATLDGTLFSMSDPTQPRRKEPRSDCWVRSHPKPNAKKCLVALQIESNETPQA